MAFQQKRNTIFERIAFWERRGNSGGETLGSYRAGGKYGDIGDLSPFKPRPCKFFVSTEAPAFRTFNQSQYSVAISGWAGWALA